MQQVRRTVTTGVRVDAIPRLDSVLSIIREAPLPFLMTFVNPATSVLAKRNLELAEMLETFDLVAPDGIGMVLAIQLLHDCGATRVSFDTTSLASLLFCFAIESRLNVVLCGGQPGVAMQAREHLLGAYDGLSIVGVFDGYSDRDAIINEINTLKPDIVICGMGSIRQEQFLLALTRSGWIGRGFTCGGFLDQLSSRGVNYYPRVIDRLNLRWAYRLAMEPRRLWRRYLLDYPIFAYGLCKALVQQPR